MMMLVRDINEGRGPGKCKVNKYLCLGVPVRPTLHTRGAGVSAGDWGERWGSDGRIKTALETRHQGSACNGWESGAWRQMVPNGMPRLGRCQPSAQDAVGSWGRTVAIAILFWNAS